MKKVQRQVPAWHTEAVKLLNANYASILSALHDSLTRAVWFGALLISIKQRGKLDGSIPHSRFIPWLKANYPDLAVRTAQEWMTAAKRAFELSEKAKILPFSTEDAPDQKREIHRFCNGGELPKEVQSVIAGKTKYALFLEWKQAQSDDDDGLVPKIGRAKGEGGRPPEPTGPIEELVAARLKQSIRLAGKADETLSKLGVDFLAWNDDQCNAFLGSLDRTAQCVRTWVNTPPSKRNMEDIAKLWKSL